MSRFTRFAKGRTHKPGIANKTELRYGDYLESLRLSGEIEWFRFEGLKLRLAEATFYTPDYAVMTANGTMECHEVKAGMVDKSGKVHAISEDASRIKIKIAAEQYPFEFRMAIERPKKAGGGFQVQAVRE